MAQKTRKIAVITGDLVDSTSLGRAKIERAFEALETSAKAQAEWHSAPLHFTRHRGDGWQVVLGKPVMALRSALAFRAALRAEGSEFGSYMGIAEGEMEGDVGPDLNSNSGDPFKQSGVALELSKESRAIGMVYYGEGLLGASATLLDQISKSWTPSQAMSLNYALDPVHGHNQTEIAHKLGKSRQAVAKSLASAGFEAIDLALGQIEDTGDA